MAIRIATNSIIIIMLIAGGVALYYTVEAVSCDRMYTYE